MEADNVIDVDVINDDDIINLDDFGDDEVCLFNWKFYVIIWLN